MMTDYYPIDDLEEVDLDLLLKRWKANGFFSKLSETEVLHLLCWHEWEGYIKLFTWELHGYVESLGANIEFLEGFNLDLEGKIFLSIEGFNNADDLDLDKALEGQPKHYYVWGRVYGGLLNLASNKSVRFKEFPIDYIRLSKADVKTIETGKFKKLNTQEKRDVKMREYIFKHHNDFPDGMTQVEAWSKLTAYDSKVFPPLGREAINVFFNKASLTFKQGAPKKK